MAVRRARGIFRDEEGLTTVSMALSIFLALALIFGAGQLYRISSTAADIQEVADVAVLASQEEVSKFMSVANGCDGMLFTMTLASEALMGVGIVAACIPSAATVAQKLISMGRKVADARDACAQKMADGLNVLQRALPFIAAAKAADLCERNQLSNAATQYQGAALLLPSSGVEISVAGDGLSDLVDAVEAEAPDIMDRSQQAEELAKEADESKLRAWKADCGDQPGKCMYERADRLGSLSGSSNPCYSSVDAWSFRVALERAQCYYQVRSECESAFNDTGLTCEDRADSVLRKHFYRYASEQMTEALAVAGERCEMPRLFRNLDEMRDTNLYDDQLFPVTVTDGGQMMHAWEGCPRAAGSVRRASIAELQAGAFQTCPECELTPSTFGNVASASTSTESGFEHYYRIVQEACAEYNEAMDRLDPLKDQVESSVSSLFQQIGDLLSDGAGAKRIHAEPPGWAGSIAVVVDLTQHPADAGFENLFIAGGATLGTRAAVSAASLQLDEELPDTIIVDELTDALGAAVPGADAPARIAADMWLGLLRTWNEGADAITSVLEEGVNSLHTTTASGLGKWASDALSSLMEGLGLEPPQLYRLRPVFVNTGAVAEADGSAFSVGYLQMKQGALSASSSQADPFSALSAAMQNAMGSWTEGTIEVAQIGLPVGDAEIPITIALPTSVGSGAQGLLSGCLDAIANTAASIAGVRSWQ